MDSALDNDNEDWIDTPEAAELRKQMATLEEKITNFKQEIETQDDEEQNDDDKTKVWQGRA